MKKINILMGAIACSLMIHSAAYAVNNCDLTQSAKEGKKERDFFSTYFTFLCETRVTKDVATRLADDIKKSDSKVIKCIPVATSNAYNIKCFVKGEKQDAVTGAMNAQSVE